MLLRLSSWRVAVVIGFLAAVSAVGARAADTTAGSKNFAAPTSVPNYFSNEAGPLQGPASETQRGPLYMNQAYGTPGAAVARGPQHVAFAEPRGRYVHGRVAYDRHGRPIASRQIGAHGRPVYRAVAHSSARGHATHVVAHSGAVAHHTTQVSTVHHHARG
ncbi:MAG TPA: hypothetical protein VK432_09700 [Stellaceae bacterium]|nr:hypothetical protein [Stellaceae bacterium]